MRILPIKSYSNFKQNHTNTITASGEENKSSQKKRKTLIYTSIALLACAGVGYKYVFSIKNKQLSDTPKEYITNLAESLSKWLHKDVKASSLKSIISGEELLIELKNLKKENFVASAENIEKGIFCADLHSHSLHSDGLGKVENILNQVAKYGDDLNKKNGKKFIFALTDHDSCDGVKEALKIISENPEKFKNVKFVTGTELSFIIESNKTSNPFETSEVLVYGFNPFEEKIENYFSSLRNKRKDMVKNYINDLKQMFGYADFSIEEFNKIYGKNYMMNYQWKVHNYGQTKNAISGLAISQNKDKAKMYEEIMSQTERWKKTLYDLHKKDLVPESYGEDSRIMDLCKQKYSPKWDREKIDYNCEANFEDIVKIFGENKNTFGAFAHPYYVTERNSNANNLLDDLIKKSNGFVKATESHHQAYRSHLDSNEIEKFNQKLVATNKLQELGGRDNHEVDWLKK